MRDASIEAMYRVHGRAVLRRARQILGDEQEANEVLQEIFVGLLDRPDQFKGQSSITTFLYSVTTNMCLNRLRNARNRTRLLEENAGAAAPRSAPLGADDLAALHQLLARLPVEEASAAVYYYLDGMSHAEIADLQGCSRRQVGYLLERLVQRMHEELAP
ncbi:MAG TPA: sigma-70 family RNA polymerase sigma factor [Kofleriaceae bacterium]|nr:sigma-70 family RNA polymerase sigma factor [Kofleriaceae bacterium]